MKKKLAVKLATLMCAVTSIGQIAHIAAPDSFYYGVSQLHQ